ncbi:hypothetical protein EDEG_02973 [Edhazardia aedis USNM 41457]|uniref:Uncharacterized protein n=1 Tax=Edhazardia aedis (strain USNM 41457) TaxID=1003232 RepID=J9D4B8_EDHAE|nr:hypothetical protein EDEG_02973 [Edhazardia aedis USNM 41457]|eukprot:EJW02631.1 hypothetical protein EDEG_02973 [Edhazardia aedis USNM 41457]
MKQKMQIILFFIFSILCVKIDGSTEKISIVVDKNDFDNKFFAVEGEIKLIKKDDVPVEVFQKATQSLIEGCKVYYEKSVKVFFKQYECWFLNSSCSRNTNPQVHDKTEKN